MINFNKLLLAIFSVYLIRYMFLYNQLFFILLIGSFIVVTFLMVSLILGLLLDKLYRPKIPQYPFNTYLDRVIPLIFLSSPTTVIILLSPYEAWFTRLGLLIVIHIVIIIPILHYWSNLRTWNSIDDTFTYKSWNHPRLYKHIAIASIYPLIWAYIFHYHVT